MRLEHGERNEELCDILLRDLPGRFNDWAVTTAFYACIHFVEHKIFPARICGNRFENFKAYCNHQYNVRENHRSKHSLKSSLVREMIPGISSTYNRLKDASMHTRYEEYRIPDEDAEKANKSMKKVKKACLE